MNQDVVNDMHVWEKCFSCIKWSCFKKTRVDQSRRICCPCTSTSVSHAFGFLSVSRESSAHHKERQVKQQTVAKSHREKHRERTRLRQRWLLGIHFHLFVPVVMKAFLSFLRSQRSVFMSHAIERGRIG